MPCALAPEETARRVREAARRHELRATAGAEDALEGELEKPTPFGPVRARWRAEPGALVVTVVARPAFLPETTVRRALENGLRELLGGGA